MPLFKGRKADMSLPEVSKAGRILELAQQTADQAIADAQRKAEEIIAEARQEAERITADARARAEGF
jgi:F0F1-type ATP synthase membrane subunit b/b'